MSELLPCPFCGVRLVPNKDQEDLYVRRYGTHYDHPMGNCFVADMEIFPSQVDAWNTRAQPAPAGDAQRIAEWAQAGIADFIADNWTDRKYTLAEVEQRIRAIEIRYPRAAQQGQPAPAQQQEGGT